jgi:hypothetical protein
MVEPRLQLHLMVPLGFLPVKADHVRDHSKGACTFNDTGPVPAQSAPGGSSAIRTEPGILLRILRVARDSFGAYQIASGTNRGKYFANNRGLSLAPVPKVTTLSSRRIVHGRVAGRLTPNHDARVAVSKGVLCATWPKRKHCPVGND